MSCRARAPASVEVERRAAASSSRRPAIGPDNVSAETFRADTRSTHVGANELRPDNSSTETPRADTRSTHVGANALRSNLLAITDALAHADALALAHADALASVEVERRATASSAQLPATGPDDVSAETCRAETHSTHVGVNEPLTHVGASESRRRVLAHVTIGTEGHAAVRR